MTRILTVRLDAQLLAAAEARAARLGLDRTKYVRSLIEEDLAGKAASPVRRFASEDLAGMYEGTGSPANNVAARDRLRRKSMGTWH